MRWNGPNALLAVSVGKSVPKGSVLKIGGALLSRYGTPLLSIGLPLVFFRSAGRRYLCAGICVRLLAWDAVFCRWVTGNNYRNRRLGQSI